MASMLTVFTFEEGGRVIEIDHLAILNKDHLGEYEVYVDEELVGEFYIPWSGVHPTDELIAAARHFL